MELRIGRTYHLEDLDRAEWDAPSPKYGAPRSLAARYLGSIQGNRRWHGFEVWIEGKDAGVLFMNDDDLRKIRVTPISGSL
jgi:hypothetical protein